MSATAEALLFLVLLGPWVLLITSGVLWRRHAGLPILMSRPSDAIFYSAAARGSSRGNPFHLLLNGRVVDVAVTPTELRIDTAFPVNLMLLGNLADLQHRVPRAAVRSSLTPGFMADAVLVEFTGADGQPRAIKLHFNSPDRFVRAIELGQ